MAEIGGDSQVFLKPLMVTGRMAKLIDAHSVQSGEFTEQRTDSNGKGFYLTKAGAAAFDELTTGEIGQKSAVQKDPSGLLGGLFSSSKHYATPEEFKGKR